MDGDKPVPTLLEFGCNRKIIVASSKVIWAVLRHGRCRKNMETTDGKMAEAMVVHARNWDEMRV